MSDYYVLNPNIKKVIDVYDILLDKIEEISIEKQEIEEYNSYIKAWKKFEKLKYIDKLDDEEVLL
jgi:hypothetical protein